MEELACCRGRILWDAVPLVIFQREKDADKNSECR